MAAGRALAAYLEDGSERALEAYAPRIAEVAGAYEQNRRTTHGFEPRWRDRSFWARRLAGAPGSR